MISDDEKRRALLEERWERTNLFYAVGSCLIAFVSFSFMVGTANKSIGEIQEIWKNSSQMNLILLFIEIGIILSLLSASLKRIKTIESYASNWNHANQLGRGTIVFSKRVLIIALVFIAVEVINIIWAVNS